MRYIKTALLSSIALAYSFQALAADMTGDQHTILYAGFDAGSFQPEGNPAKIHLDDDFYLSGNIGFFLNPYFSVQVDLLDFTRDGYRLPEGVNFPGRSTNEFSLATQGVAVNAIANYPIAWFRPYMGVGAGYYRTELSIRGTCFIFCNYDTISESSLAYQMLVGVDFDLGDSISLGLAWRKIYLNEDYGIYTNGPVDVGGDAITLAMKFKSEL